MPTKKLPEVLEVADMERVEFENLHRHEHLSKQIRSKGGRFEITREQALEIAFMGALCRVGFKPSNARSEVARWLKQHRAGKLEAMWAANPRRPFEPDDGLGVGYDDRSFTFDVMSNADPDQSEDTGYAADKMARAASTKKAVQIVFIDRAEILRRVDELFGSDA